MFNDPELLRYVLRCAIERIKYIVNVIVTRSRTPDPFAQRRQTRRNQQELIGGWIYFSRFCLKPLHTNSRIPGAFAGNKKETDRSQSYFTRFCPKLLYATNKFTKTWRICWQQYESMGLWT